MSIAAPATDAVATTAVPATPITASVFDLDRDRLERVIIGSPVRMEGGASPIVRAIEQLRDLHAHRLSGHFSRDRQARGIRLETEQDRDFCCRRALSSTFEAESRHACVREREVDNPGCCRPRDLS